MTKIMNILEVYLKLCDMKYLRLDGSTKTEERGTLVRQFNAPDSPYFMFLLSTRAGGLGLNLQTADTVIIFDSDRNPQMDLQAEDRAHRIGQKKDVRVFVFVSVGSIEEVVLERAKQKKGIDAKVIQAGLFNTTATGEERKAMLQEIMRRGTSSLGTDVPSEREINRLAARTDEDFWLFEKMDEERRQREGYKSRLMEEHEVPDWVFPRETEEEIKASIEAENQRNGLVTGKRRRRDVDYADQLSDYEFLKAVEGGEDVSILPSTRRKRRKKSADDAASHETVSDDGLEAQATPSEPRNSNTLSLVSEDCDDMSSRTLRKSYARTSLQPDGDEGEEFEGDDSSWRGGNVVTWKTHKRKRSSHGIAGSSSNAKGS